MTMTKTILLRLTEAEHAEITRLARESGLSISRYVARQCADTPVAGPSLAGLRAHAEAMLALLGGASPAPVEELAEVAPEPSPEPSPEPVEDIPEVERDIVPAIVPVPVPEPAPEAEVEVVAPAITPTIAPTPKPRKPRPLTYYRLVPVRKTNSKRWNPAGTGATPVPTWRGGIPEWIAAGPEMRDAFLKMADRAKVGVLWRVLHGYKPPVAPAITPAITETPSADADALDWLCGGG